MPAQPAAKPAPKQDGGLHIEEDIVLGGYPYGYGVAGAWPGAYDPWAAPLVADVEFEPYGYDVFDNGLGWANAWDELNVPGFSPMLDASGTFVDPAWDYGYGDLNMPFAEPMFADMYGYGEMGTLGYDVAVDTAYPFSE